MLSVLGDLLVWVMDEVDRVFNPNKRNSFLGILRSWLKSRAICPNLDKLNLVLVTSTESYQLIDDLNQSPFNVRQVIELEDFIPALIADLNRRHDSPFDDNSFQQLLCLLSGHDYLVASRQITPTQLFTNASASNGAFGYNLRQLLSILKDKQQLRQEDKRVINQNICSEQLFWRLWGYRLVLCFRAGSLTLLSVVHRIFSGESA